MDEIVGEIAGQNFSLPFRPASAEKNLPPDPGTKKTKPGAPTVSERLPKKLARPCGAMQGRAMEGG